MEIAQHLLTPEEMTRQWTAKGVRFVQRDFYLSKFLRRFFGTQREGFKPTMEQQQLNLDLGEVLETTEQEGEWGKMAFGRGEVVASESLAARMHAQVWRMVSGMGSFIVPNWVGKRRFVTVVELFFVACCMEEFRLSGR